MWLNLLNGEGAFVRKLSRFELLTRLIDDLPFEPIIQVELARDTQRFDEVEVHPTPVKRPRIPGVY